jgi:hypothetical protein
MSTTTSAAPAGDETPAIYVTVNINVHTGKEYFGPDSADKLKRRIQDIVKDELVQQSRPGGLFQKKNRIADDTVAPLEDGAFIISREAVQKLSDINSFLQLSSDRLNRFSEYIFNVAKETDQPARKAAEIAAEFSKQGLDSYEVAKRTRDALILARLSGLSEGGLSESDARFAVSAKDLADALSRAGSAASDAGVGFDRLIALIISAQQTTARDGAVIGNALKTIFARVNHPEFEQSISTAIFKDIAETNSTYRQVLKSITASTSEAIKRNNELNAAIEKLNKPTI